jgi:hypothetical protein
MVPAGDRRGVYGGDQYWAEPDVDAAAAHLAAVAADPAAYEPMRHAARAMASERLGVGGFAAAVAAPLGTPDRRLGRIFLRAAPARAAERRFGT